MGSIGGRLKMLGRPDDVLNPRSRNNVHVTRAADLDPVGPWSRETLYAAVRRADSEERVVVLDYGRREIYLTAGAGIAYEPPQGLGLASPPTLHVAEPHRFAPGQRAATAIDPVDVAPEFDILVPAFDWDEIDDDDVLPPVHRRPSGTSAGSGAGTSG
ncbi:hypothetical protein ABNG03_16680 [Halorubrum sp. RMP-47]|uniref:Uncharacterized protein n=1 Tax=Halorubrum miltondacostae TaxID=3076378 RepID=A0ABD5M2D6_9EURY